MAKPAYEELMKERNELREQVENLTADRAPITDVETLHSNEKELEEARAELASMKAQLTKERDEARAVAQILRAEIISKEKVKQYLPPPGGLHLQDFRGTKTPAYLEWLASQNNTQPTE